MTDADADDGRAADPLDREPQDGSRRRFMAGLAATASAAALPMLPDAASAAILPSPQASGIDHIVVVMMENRSFDHMLGWVPGANGAQAGLQYPDANGVLQATRRLRPDYQGLGLEDPPHGYAHGRVCVGGGSMDGFLLETPVGDTFPVGYYAEEDLPFYAGCAKQWTICDQYHTGLLASTQPNRMYMHCGQSDRISTGSGLPKLTTLRSIWDAAKAKGVGARYYYSNLPFTALWGLKHLDISLPITSFYIDAAFGRLPAISYVDPFFYQKGLDALCNDDHPFADVRKGQDFLNHVYNALRNSPQWSRTLLVINYDEWGGFFDHVVPPYMPVSDVERNEVGNDGRLGIRTPCVLIGPRVRKGHVERMLLEPNSILKFMEWRWGLEALGVRSAVTNNLAHALDFVNPPRTDKPKFAVPLVLGAGDSALLLGRARPASAAGSGAMTASMVAHADEVASFIELARRYGFPVTSA